MKTEFLAGRPLREYFFDKPNGKKETEVLTGKHMTDEDAAEVAARARAISEERSKEDSVEALLSAQDRSRSLLDQYNEVRQLLTEQEERYTQAVHDLDALLVKPGADPEAVHKAEVVLRIEEEGLAFCKESVRLAHAGYESASGHAPVSAASGSESTAIIKKKVA